MFVSAGASRRKSRRKLGASENSAKKKTVCGPKKNGASRRKSMRKSRTSKHGVGRRGEGAKKLFLKKWAGHCVKQALAQVGASPGANWAQGKAPVHIYRSNTLGRQSYICVYVLIECMCILHVQATAGALSGMICASSRQGFF